MYACPPKLTFSEPTQQFAKILPDKVLIFPRFQGRMAGKQQGPQFPDTPKGKILDVMCPRNLLTVDVTHMILGVLYMIPGMVYL